MVDEIHDDAREATARQIFKAIQKQERPDIAIALILRGIDDWYAKGLLHGKRKVRPRARYHNTINQKQEKK